MSIDEPYKDWSKKPGDLGREFTRAANPPTDGPPPNDRDPPNRSDHAPALVMKPKPPGSVGQEVDNAAHIERQEKMRKEFLAKYGQKGQDKADDKSLRDIFKENADKDGKDSK